MDHVVARRERLLQVAVRVLEDLPDRAEVLFVGLRGMRLAGRSVPQRHR